MGEELASAVAAVMPEKGYVFGTRDGKPRKNNLLREFKRHMRKALLSLGYTEADAGEELKLLDIHSLRYTFITELIDAGVNPKTVQALAGHSNIQTTLGIYAQCRQGSIDAAIDKLPWSMKNLSSQIRHKTDKKASGSGKEKPASR